MGAFLMALSGAASADTFTLYSTGFSSSGTKRVAGLADGNWTLVNVLGTTVNNPAFVTIGSGLNLFPFTNGAWMHDTNNSQWISPAALEESSQGAGEYVYQQTFSLTGLNPESVVITGQWSADNYGDIVVNGVEVTGGTSGIIPNSTGEFTKFTSFVLNSSNADFVVGTNTIQFDVFNNSNGDPDVTGLNVNIESRFAQDAPEPSTFALIGFGFMALGVGARKFRR